MVSTQQAADWVSADDQGIQIALSIQLTPELKQEGIARDFVRQVQQQRKDLDLEIQDRIRISYDSADADLLASLKTWSNYIRTETLADEIKSDKAPAETKPVLVGAVQIPIWIRKV